MKNSRKKRYSIAAIMIVICLIVSSIVPVSIKAASMEIKYNKKTYQYKDKQVSMTLDESPINMKKTPGILIDGTSLVSYKDVFQNALGATCKYNTKTKAIVIRQFGNKVKLFLNKTTAYINGKRTSIAVAPKKVTYVNQNKTKILIPSRFVAEALGYEYVWNSNTSTVSMTTPYRIYYAGKWRIYSGTNGKVTINGKAVDVSDMPGTILNGTTLVQAKKVFASSSIQAKYQYNKATKKITLTKDNTTIKMTIGSTKATVNGTSYQLETAPRSIKNNRAKVSYVMVPAYFVAEQFGYNYQWDSYTGTSIITMKNTPTVTPKPSSVPEPTATPKPSNSELPEQAEEYFTLNMSNAFQEDVAKLATLQNNYTLIGEENPENKSELNNILFKKDVITNKETYILTSSTPFSKITSSYHADKKKISIYLSNTTLTLKPYELGGTLVEGIETINKDPDLSVDITLTDKYSRYELLLSEDKCELSLVIYPNYLTNITAHKNNDSESVILSGTAAFIQPKVTSDEQHIYLTLEHTYSALSKTVETVDGVALKSVSVTSSGDSVLITIEKEKIGEYNTLSLGNGYSVTITKPEEEEEEEPEEEEGDDNNEDVIDTTYSLKIMCPDGVKFSSIKDTDNYLSRKFSITIPGDHINYFSNNPIQKNNSAITNVSTSLSGGNTIITVSTNKVQGYKLVNNGSYIGVIVDNPSKIYNKIVLLDPGHGGSAPGASNGAYQEKDITLKILYTAAKKYFDGSDIKAYWTRESDAYVDNMDRARFSAEVEADFYISLHMNSATSSSAYGFEVWYATGNTSSTRSGLTSAKLAKIFNERMFAKLNLGTNRGVKTNAWTVCHYNSVPAILVELAFISNSSDLNKIKDSTFQDKTAAAIYQICQEVFQQYPTGR